jgi:SAM-dependent methyltransferase
MKGLDSPSDVLDWLQAYSASAAVGAALELGLPWLLAEGPKGDEEISRTLGVPPGRCRLWLLVLERIGLLERLPGGWGPTAGARRAVLESYGRESWALLATEERERFPSVLDLAPRLTLPPAAPQASPGGPDDYVQRMAEDPERARIFTRMLYELHRDLAETLAAALEVGGARRLLDIGGGSGVMSLALLRRHPGLSAVVADIETVCAAGRRIAAENGMEDRITYRATDLSGPLPSGFDLVLECDVGLYTEALFARVREALNEGGRFLIADEMADDPDEAPTPWRLHWAFTAAISGPPGDAVTPGRVKEMLAAGGFTVLRETALPEGFRLIEARR